MRQTLFFVLLIYLGLFQKDAFAVTASAEQAPPAAGPAADTSTTKTYFFTLQQCIDYALKNQDSLKNAALDIRIAKERIGETVGRGLPNISLNGTAGRSVIVQRFLIDASSFPSTTGKPIPPGTLVPFALSLPWNSTVTAQGSQILFDASYLVGLKAAKVVRDLSTKSYTRSKIQTAAQVTKAYYNVLASQERLKLTANALERVEKNLNDTRALNKQGFAELIDVQRVEVQENNSKSDQTQALNGFMVAVFALKYQIGMPLEYILSVKGDVSQVNLQPLADTLSLPYASRIEYSLMETKLEGDRLTWKNDKSALLPKLSATATYGYNWSNTTFQRWFSMGLDFSTVGLSLTWNIFDGTQTIHKIQESRLAYEKSKNDLDNLKRGLQFQVQNSRVAYLNNFSLVESQKRNRTLAENVYNTAKIKYTEGIGSSLELNDAELSLRDAESNYVNALLNVLVSKVDLDQALGNINP